MKKMMFAIMLMLFLVFVTSAGAAELNADNNDILLTSDVSSPPDDEALPEADEKLPAEQDPDVVDEEPGSVDDEDTDSQIDEEEPVEKEDN